MRSIKVIFSIFVIGLFASSISAQIGRTKPKAKPLATPPQVITGAEIISQAGDYSEPIVVPEEKAPTKVPINNAERIRQLNDRIKKLEAAKKDTYEDRQKRLLMNLDILTRAEQRSESLRKQLFGMIEKENAINARLEQIDYDIRPEVIERALQIAGSMRPEEIREGRRRSLEAERRNLQALLTDIQVTRGNLNVNLQKAELMVERLRLRAEKDIDDSLQQDDPVQKDDEPEN